MNQKKKTPPAGQALARRIMELAREKKATDITMLSLSGDTGIADYYVICETDNPMHTRAIADGITVPLKEEGATPWHTEGLEDGRWILIDYSDVIVHIMLDEVREFYQLESLWPAVRPSAAKS